MTTGVGTVLLITSIFRCLVSSDRGLEGGGKDNKTYGSVWDQNKGEAKEKRTKKGK